MPVRARRWLLIAALAGCGGGGAKDAAGPDDAARAQKLACERTADHLVSLMAPGRKDLPPEQAPTEVADTIARTLVTRCVGDSWSPDATGCFQRLTALEGADACAPLLTVEQRDAMDRAMEAALGPRAAPPNN